jgi:hypothetical protein
VLQQVLTGKYADGLGGIKTVPDRADFDPMPWQSMAVWMLTQMKRWGYIKGDVNYRQIAEKVFLITDAKKHMKELARRCPRAPTRSSRSWVASSIRPRLPSMRTASRSARRAVCPPRRHLQAQGGAAVAAAHLPAAAGHLASRHGVLGPLARDHGSMTPSRSSTPR